MLFNLLVGILETSISQAFQPNGIFAKAFKIKNHAAESFKPKFGVFTGVPTVQSATYLWASQNKSISQVLHPDGVFVKAFNVYELNRASIFVRLLIFLTITQAVFGVYSATYPWTSWKNIICPQHVLPRASFKAPVSNPPILSCISGSRAKLHSV